MIDDASRSEGLFEAGELPKSVAPKPKVKRLDRAIWTENKARLIELYLKFFVYITKHGTYIDGFAGPQQPDCPEMWAASLVLANEPKWFRHFYFFEQNRQQIERLKELKKSQPAVDSKGNAVKRDIKIFEGDFNISLDALLASECIRQKEATFCLLDQRTFECRWESVRKLAAYKNSDNNKIELFYFLPIGWLDRALSALKDRDKLEAWWGRDDFEALRGMKNAERKTEFVKRFEDELGYKSVMPWPVYEHQGSRRIMYHMIHATDHPEAPGLMSRAYNAAVLPKESLDQLVMEFGLSVAEKGSAADETF